MKTNPMRTCIICKKELPKDVFLRLVKVDNCVMFDIEGKISGRGAYICPQTGCIKQVHKKGIMDRHLKLEISQKDIINLQNHLLEHTRKQNG